MEEDLYVLLKNVPKYAEHVCPEGKLQNREHGVTLPGCYIYGTADWQASERNDLAIKIWKKERRNTRHRTNPFSQHASFGL